MERKLEAILSRFEEIDARLSAAPGIEELTALLKERKSLEPLAETAAAYFGARRELGEVQALLSSADDPLFREMAEQECAALTDRLHTLTAQAQALLVPRNPEDGRNVIMEIRAGAGGEEAALFAADLFRMYTMYPADRGWQIRPMNENETELGGYREISYMVIGEGAYSALKYESGVHRVQRVPRTESQGRIQTSTVTVAVLPEVEDVQVEIAPADIEVETLKSSGAGGQHINKTESAVRIYHKPSGLVVFCQQERSQIKNRETAMKMLRAKLYEAERERQESTVAATRRTQLGTGDRSEKIRTYNYPQSRVTDHRISLTLHKLDAVLNGALEDILTALATAEAAEKMKAGTNEN